MTRKLLTTLLAAAIAAASLASPAAAKARKHKPAPTVHAWSAPAVQQPARMIEVRPGLWISSYGCISDEGYGRYVPCDLTDGKR